AGGAPGVGAQGGPRSGGGGGGGGGGEDGEGTAARPAAATGANELVRGQEDDEQRPERDAPVHVRPDDEEREGEPDPSRRGARLAREEPEERRVQREREHLRADRPCPRRGDEHREEHHPERTR